MLAKRLSFQQALDDITRQCLADEQNRSLSDRSIAELSLHFQNFARFCASHKIVNFIDLTPAFFEDFIHSFDDRYSPALTKAVVWAMRKLGAFLALRQLLPENPARHLKHPAIVSRQKLPQWLKPAHLRTLLEHVLEHNPMQDFCIVSLLASVGMRPQEIVELRRKDIRERELLNARPRRIFRSL